MKVRFAQEWQFRDFVRKISAIFRKIMGNFGFYAKILCYLCEKWW